VGENRQAQAELIARKFPELTSNAEARKTLAWLHAKVAGEAGAIEDDWNRVRSRMEGVNSNRTVMRAVPIVNDFWMCKKANTIPRPANIFEFGEQGLQMSNWGLQRWHPPEDWAEWPRFDVDLADWLNGLNLSRTAQCKQLLPTGAAGGPAAERRRAMQILGELASGAAGIAGLFVVSQAVAWLDTALGRLGKIFDHGGAEDVAPQILLQDLADSVIPSTNLLFGDMVEGALQPLYGSIREQGHTLVTQFTLGGQSSEWRDYFQALSRPSSPAQALMTVQLAALTLRSESVWYVLELLRQTETDNQNLSDLSACVRRRWLLALKALAWVEISLQRPTPFELVTPADLMCFGITSLLPLYPRPIVAVSHRSGDAKPLLKEGKVWGANEVMIDATFRPVWQTNRAMIWSLFAATPVLCKVRSRTYDDSEWCRRESEMFDHLSQSADFLGGRLRFDINLDEVRALDRAAVSWPKIHRIRDMAEGIESPPMEILKFKTWQGALIRAVAVARFAHRFLALADRPPKASASELANVFLNRLCSGQDVPADSLFGVVEGWRVLSESIRADAALLGLEGPLARACGDREVERAEEWFNQAERGWPGEVAADLNLCDVLAALDWREHLEPHLRAQNKGTCFEFQAGVIDLRNTNEAEWANDPGWAVARGLIFLRLPYPLNIRQRAGQDVDKWPHLRDVDIPIFTEHLPDQRLPLSEVFFSLGGPWPALYCYAVRELVDIVPVLMAACLETMKGRTGPVDPVLMRADGGLSAMSIDGGSDLEDWLRTQHEAQPGDRGEQADETGAKQADGPEQDS
jgi:hypothetical protein